MSVHIAFIAAAWDFAPDADADDGKPGQEDDADPQGYPELPVNQQLLVGGV